MSAHVQIIWLFFFHASGPEPQNTSRTSRGPTPEWYWFGRMTEALSGLPAADPATPAANTPTAHHTAWSWCV